MRFELDIGWHTANMRNPLAGVSTSGVFGSRPRQRKPQTGCPHPAPAPTTKTVVILMPRDAEHVQALKEMCTWICEQDTAGARYTASFVLPVLQWWRLSVDEQQVHSWLQNNVCNRAHKHCPALRSIMLVVWWAGEKQPGGVWLTLAASDAVSPEGVRAVVADIRQVVVNGLVSWM